MKILINKNEKNQVQATGTNDRIVSIFDEISKKQILLIDIGKKLYDHEPLFLHVEYKREQYDMPLYEILGRCNPTETLEIKLQFAELFI